MPHQVSCQFTESWLREVANISRARHGLFPAGSLSAIRLRSGIPASPRPRRANALAMRRCAVALTTRAALLNLLNRRMRTHDFPLTAYCIRT
eukprot:6190439-Pleurochrysis_carterae.AAC.2